MSQGAGSAELQIKTSIILGSIPNDSNGDASCVSRHFSSGGLVLHIIFSAASRIKRPEPTRGQRAKKFVGDPLSDAREGGRASKTIARGKVRGIPRPETRPPEFQEPRPTQATVDLGGGRLTIGSR
eukprot:4313172-Pyramimonas_sp.AAC.1